MAETGEEKMTSVYVVEVGDCESSWIVSIHQSKVNATVTWNEQRLKLIENARHMLEWSKTKDGNGSSIEMYERMIKNLEETDPEKIDNYPHDCVHLTEHELEE